jgi:hypothetical protein
MFIKKRENGRKVCRQYRHSYLGLEFKRLKSAVRRRDRSRDVEVNYMRERNNYRRRGRRESEGLNRRQESTLWDGWGNLERGTRLLDKRTERESGSWLVLVIMKGNELRYGVRMVILSLGREKKESGREREKKI